MFPLNVFATDSEDEIIPNDETGIPDKGLYQAILYELDSKEKTFTKNEASTVTWLTIGININKTPIYNPEKDYKVMSLRGIGNLINLEYLNVSNKDITEISELKNLKNLKGLNVSSNKLISASGIENLTELSELNLAGCNLKELPDLTKLTHLHPEFTHFTYNKLSAKELKAKLPIHLWKGDKWFTAYKEWFADQKTLQNLSQKITLKSPKKYKSITYKTKNITCKTDKNFTVRLIWRTHKTIKRNGIKYKISYVKTIKAVKANKKGIARFKKLNLKKYRGKHLELQVIYKCKYLKHERGTELLADRKFTIK